MLNVEKGFLLPRLQSAVNLIKFSMSKPHVRRFRFGFLIKMFIESSNCLRLLRDEDVTIKHVRRGSS